MAATLTTQDVAERLGVHVDTVVKWINDQELPAINVAANRNSYAKRWRIDPYDLDLFENSRKTTPRQMPVRRRVEPKARNQ